MFSMGLRETFFTKLSINIIARRVEGQSKWKDYVCCLELSMFLLED